MEVDIWIVIASIYLGTLILSGIYTTIKTKNIKFLLAIILMSIIPFALGLML